MKRKFRFLFILAPIAFISLGSLITMGLWNWLVPVLFKVGTITFLQAAGILILARILSGAKGFHRHGRMHFAHAGSCHPHGPFRKAWMHNHCEELTPEQREKFAERFGYHPKENKEA
ncbi:MAG: hypothetical protein HXX13_03055 [Bacteroidetes bacterium]|nr:hypothetical protein [Bacteroidota bacterium]